MRCGVSVLFSLLTFIERGLLLGIGIFDQSNVFVPVKQLLMHAPGANLRTHLRYAVPFFILRCHRSELP
jgi:hypothetical protein